jgi:hypothetical protein
MIVAVVVGVLIIVLASAAVGTCIWIRRRRNTDLIVDHRPTLNEQQKPKRLQYFFG